MEKVYNLRAPSHISSCERDQKNYIIRTAKHSTEIYNFVISYPVQLRK